MIEKLVFGGSWVESCMGTRNHLHSRPHTMFCPHYRRYRGNATEIVPITAVTAVLPR